MRKSAFISNDERTFRKQFRTLKTRGRRIFFNVKFKYKRIYHNIRDCRTFTNNIFLARQFTRIIRQRPLVYSLQPLFYRFTGVIYYAWYLACLLLSCTFYNTSKFRFGYPKCIQTRWVATVVHASHKLPHVFWHLLFRNIFFMAFVNSLIRSGKKEKVELLLFRLLCSLKYKTRKQPIFFMNNLFQTLQPVVETFPFTISGRSYPVPKVVLSNKRLTFLVRIMKTITNKQKKKFNFNIRFLRELILASSRTGSVYSTILDMHRFSFDNRINMRFIRRRRKKRRAFM